MVRLKINETPPKIGQLLAIPRKGQFRLDLSVSEDDRSKLCHYTWEGLKLLTRQIRDNETIKARSQKGDNIEH